MKIATWQFPPHQKSYRHEWEYLLSLCSHVAQMQKHWEGKIWCEFMGKEWKNMREQSPSLFSHHTGILVFGDFVISRPDGCNAHMEVSELSFLKSLRKLIFMILMRDVAHSDQISNFVVSQQEDWISPKRTTSSVQADCCSHMEISQGKQPNTPLCASWIRLHWDPFRNFCSWALNPVLLSRWTHGAEHNCPSKNTDPPKHTTTF